VLGLRGRSAWTPRRDQAYLGVLVDDLISSGVSEPYRMFTSRAEYRLSLREDNADLRLTPVGRELGCVDDARWEAFCRKRDAVAQEVQRLRSTWVNPRLLPAAEAARVLGAPLEREYTLASLLKRPNVSYRSLSTLVAGDGTSLGPQGGLEKEAAAVAAQVEISIKYDGYIARQGNEIARQAAHETTRLPDGFDYDAVRGLSIEVRQKLKAHQPGTVGAAARISGVTPAAISLLLVHLKRMTRGQTAVRTAADDPSAQRAA
jgi:tRNA uridine 5-carboxymethylaminomethyl modification enzyme